MTVEAENKVEKQGDSTSESESTFGKIETVTKLLQKADLSKEEIEKVHKLLREINSEVKQKEGKTVSYFKDEVMARLKILFPEDPVIAEMEKSGQVVDGLALYSGTKAFDRIFQNIKVAKTIYINMFLWRDDEIGNNMGKALLDAAKRGAKITIVKDRIGGIYEYAEQGKQSFLHKSLPASLKIKADIVDRFYLNPQKANPLADALKKHSNVNFVDAERNDHSKYFIFDGSKIITGGMNIGDEYAKDKFHDYMVEFSSAILAQRLLDGKGQNHDQLGQASNVDFVMNRRLSSDGKEFEIKPEFLKLMESASSYVDIEMAYFGDKDVTNAIIKCANRGIRVNIILPEKANVGHDLNMSVVQKILSATEGNNINFYSYPGMVHAKVVNIDGKTTFMGSANLNKQGTQDLEETNLLVTDGNCAFTSQVVSQLQEDKAKSKSLISPPAISFNRFRAFLEKTV